MCKNSKWTFSNSFFVVRGTHIKTIRLHLVVFNKDDILHFRNNVLLSKHLSNERMIFSVIKVKLACKFPNFCLPNNLEQKPIYKFTKSGKNVFPMECFIAAFWWFFSTNVKIYLLGDQPGTRHQIQAFQKIFLKVPNFLRSKVLSCTIIRLTTCAFIFWW